MICNYSSVLFVNISLILCYYFVRSSELKVFIESHNAVYKCSTDEYLIIRNWTQFHSLNISCSNEPPLSDRLLDIFQYRLPYSNCDTKNKLFSTEFFLTIVSSAFDKNNDKITDEQLNLLSSTVVLGKHTDQFKPTRTNKSQRVSIYKIPLPWTSERRYTWYVLFRDQPIACLVYLNYTALIDNERCTNNTIWNYVICYHESSSVSPLQNVNWTLLNDLVFTNKYIPDNWHEKGGILYDARLHKTATTSSTVATTSLSDSTSTLNKATTSIAGTHSTLAITIGVTTINSNKSKSMLKQAPKIKPKPAQRNSSVSRATRTRKKTSSSSSPSLLLIFLLIIVICGIIGSVAFFIFRYYRKQHNEDDQHLLDRVDSNESNRSEMDESETSTPMKAPPQPQSEQVLAKKANA